MINFFKRTGLLLLFIPLAVLATIDVVFFFPRLLAVFVFTGIQDINPFTDPIFAWWWLALSKCSTVTADDD